MDVIRNKRENHGYTQSELAKRSGLSLRTIQRLEASGKEPKGHSLIALSEAFNMETSALQNEFRNDKKTSETDASKVKWLNLSILSFLGIPFGNVILPIILWRIHRDSSVVDEAGKRIINFQIIFSIVLAILLCVCPFFSRVVFSNTGIILYILFLAYAFNVVVVFIIARKIQRDNFDFLDLRIRLI